MIEDEMVGWYHRLHGHEFEQAPGVGNGQGSLACCRPWGRKELDVTQQLNNMFIIYAISAYAGSVAPTQLVGLTYV